MCCCFKKKVQSNGTVVRAAVEEKFGGKRARELTSNQWLARAVLHPSFRSGLWHDCVPVSSMPCLAFLYKKSFATAFLY